MLEVPRSLRLAAWGAAVVRREADVARAVAAVEGSDEPHVVTGVPGAAGDGLADLLAHLRTGGATGVRAALPAPGDVLGLPGPAAFNTAALAAGECVLVDGTAAPLGLVPEVTAFGSAWETGHLVAWQGSVVELRPGSGVGQLSEVDRELRTAMVSATEQLQRLDVARGRDDAAPAIAQSRDGGRERGVRPPSAGARSVRVLATALRLRAIVELATLDDGAAVSGWEADRRREALRGLDAVARRAMVAAVNDAHLP